MLEDAITTDFGLVHALVGDRHGNLVFHECARNFNPLCAMAGRITIAEVEQLVEPGESIRTACTCREFSCSVSSTSPTVRSGSNVAPSARRAPPSDADSWI